MKRYYFLGLLMLFSLLTSCKNVYMSYDERNHWKVNQSGEIIDVEKHSFDDWYIVKEGSCKENGLKEHKCKSCGYIENEEININHTIEILPEVAPTYLNSGLTEGEKCSICGLAIKEQTTIPMLQSSLGLGFILNDTGDGYILNNVGTCEDTEITIGTHFNQLPIVGIGEKAFYGKEKITKVTIGDNVTYIGKSAFDSCIGLEYVQFSKSLKIVDEMAFHCCKNLKELNLPNGLEEIGIHAFSQCEIIKEIVLPDSVKSLGSACFHYCRALEIVYISKNISALPNNIFNQCIALKTVKLFSSIESIGNGAFLECFNLEEFDFKEGLISIGDEAFYQCNGLKEVILPNTLEIVGKEAFQNCFGIITVYIPISVTQIGSDAFKCNDDVIIYCEALSRPENWNSNWAYQSKVKWGYVKE